MLLKVIQYLKKDNIYLYPQKGVVVDNSDPKKLGRIKCTIKNRWEETNTSKLPWVYPLRSFFLGGSPDTSMFSVPEVDTELQIVFPFEDEYTPFYVGLWPNVNTSSPAFEEDYPETYGFVDSTPQWFRINKKGLFAEYFNSLDNLIHIDKEGNLWINLPKSLIINIGENLNIKMGKNLAIKVGGGSILNASAGISVQTGGNHCIEAGGNVTSKAGGIAEIKSSSSTGINSSGVVAIEGSGIDFNSGVVLGAVDGDVGSLNDLISDLEAKMADLTNKLNTLKDLAATVKSSSETSRAKIKE